MITIKMKKIFIVETEGGVPYLHHPDYMSRPDMYTSPDNGTKAAWQHLANHFHKKDIYVAVSPHVMQQISEDGRIKNQHETNSSRGHLDPEMRAKFERDFFKNNLPSLKDKPLPIYGYMSSHPMSSHWTANSYSSGDNVNQYGSVRLKIKPHLRPVTTFTRDDSLNRHFEQLTPSFATHPHWKSLISNTLKDIQPHVEKRFLPGKDDVENYTTPNETRNGHPDEFGSPYHEAQIHSQVHMHDIDSIHVLPNPENSDVDYESIGKKHSIPVHYYNTKGDKIPLEEFRQAKENQHDYDYD
jgi:hypothetical protein